jgi:hypothetical protein
MREAMASYDAGLLPHSFILKVLRILCSLKSAVLVELAKTLINPF